MSKIAVLKFGGSVLRGESDVRLATHEVYRWVRRGWKVVAVVSALHGETDSLLRRAGAHAAADGGPETARALLAGTGEFQSAAILTLELDRAGVPAVVATPWSVGLRAEGDLLDAQPASVDAARLRRLLRAADAVVVPGFVAIGPQREPVLLGRGGSDLSALFIAAELGAARCRLVKDVDGLYDRDPDPAAAPACAVATARRYETLDYPEAAVLGKRGGVVQEKAVRFAQTRGIPFEVGAALCGSATQVGPFAASFAEPPAVARPVRVALLGCGTIGRGVLDHLESLPERFDVVGVAVQDLRKDRGPGLDESLLTTDALALAAASEAELVIETLGGLEPAAAAIDAALARGAFVVTANKRVVAARLAEPTWRAAIRDGRLRFAAAVGGAAPLVEHVRRVARRRAIRRLDGVLNGTSNHVLARLAEGSAWAEAIQAAQRAGFAEADPSRDLDGRDAAEKLAILCSEAWDVPLHPADVTRTPLSHAVLAALAGAAAPGEVVRQVATAAITPEGKIQARVGPALVPADSALGRVTDEWNALVVTDGAGRTRAVRGRGAGRWPTAESVLGDALDAAASIACRHARRPHRVPQPA